MYDINSLKGVGEKRSSVKLLWKMLLQSKTIKLKTKETVHKHCTLVGKFLAHGNMINNSELA